MNRILLISILSSFTFVGTLQAQILGGWLRGYNNNYYNRNYYQPRQYQQPQQQSNQQASQQQTAKPQYKENTWYRWQDGSYRYYKNGEWLTQQQVQQSQQQQSTQQASQQQTTGEQNIDYPYIFNPARVVLTNAEKYIISEVNRLRIASGIPALVVSPSLMNSSRNQTQAMVNQTGGRVLSSIAHLHGLVPRPFWASENIVGTSSPSYAMRLWIGSSGHWANMMDRSRRYIGVGCFGNYATQQFSGNAEVPYKLVTEADIKAEEEKIKAEEEAKAKAEEEAKAKAEEEAKAQEEVAATEEVTSDSSDENNSEANNADNQE